VEPPPGFLHTHRRAVAIASVLFVVLGVAAVLIWRWRSGLEITDDAQVDGHIAHLSARVPGTVTSVLVQENDKVSKGALLVELDPRDYQVALARAEADLARAESQLEAGGARIREARATHRKARLDLDRYRYLVRENAVPRQQYEEKVAAAESSAAAVDSARAEGTPRDSALQATVLAARAAVQRARLDLLYTRIAAPTDGIVGRRGAQPGQAVQPGQELIAFVDTGDVWITANFKETQLRHMHPGQRARVHVDALDRDYDATVESLGGASGVRFSLLPPENATGNFVKVVQRLPVRIRLHPGQPGLDRLRPGMSVVPRVYVAP
jgi:membrane fusion protein (multidrug efflux system)